jgi:hypothetical protein
LMFDITIHFLIFLVHTLYSNWYNIDTD